MGNKGSCCFACSISSSSSNFDRASKTAKVLDTEGNVRQLNLILPMKSAELMIEVPGHVVVPIEELHRRQRIIALPADKELLEGKVYLMVPLYRVNSKASALESGLADQWASEKTEDTRTQDKKKKYQILKKIVKKKSGGEGSSKVSPAATVTLTVKEKKNEVGQLGGKLGGVFDRRPYSINRRWNPALDSIAESVSGFRGSMG